MTILNQLIAEAKEQLHGYKGSLRVDNIVLAKSLYTMKGSNLVFTDMNFCLILLENAYGFSYFQGEIDYSVDVFVNKNVLELMEEELPIQVRVALTDALYCVINSSRFADKRVLTGDIRQKAMERARILLARVPSGARMLLLGASSEIVEEAKAKGCSVRVLDLEEKKVGLNFFSTQIENGAAIDIWDVMVDTEYVVATGMIFLSNFADRIFKLAQENEKKLILYMETGSNFGPQLLAHGADTVLSEFFPYYDFFGETEYLLFHR